MSVIFIGGVIGEEYEKEVIENTKGAVDNAANVFQKKLLSGFRKTTERLYIFSAPLIGAFPKYYKKLCFIPKTDDKTDINYVKFNNLWAYKSISRAFALKKAVKQSITDDNEKKHVVVYCAHNPFLEAARYIKKHYKNVEVTLIVLDLPQYMVLNKKKTLIYKILKYFDIKAFNRLCEYVDSYMVLTDRMLDVLPDGRNKKSFVSEGICEYLEESTQKCENKLKKTVLYAGKLNEKFGVMNLVKAFLLINRDDLELVICGGGELCDEISKISGENPNVIFKGQVSEKEAQELVKAADVLVNPRQNDSEYTKYSFPSKNIEYLASGNSVVAYMLDGMPRFYCEFLYVPQDDSIEALAEAVLKALDSTDDEKLAKKTKVFEYIKNNLISENICRKILDINL